MRNSSLFFLLSLLFIGNVAIAQQDMTIYTDTDVTMIFTLDGQKLNSTPVSAIKITGLTKSSYQLHVEFNDGTSMDKNMFVPENNAGCTYQMKMNKDEEYYLRFVKEGADSKPGMIVVGANTNVSASTTTKTNSSTTNQPIETKQSNCTQPISQEGFETLLKSVKAASFADSKMVTAKEGTKITCLTAAQIKQIVLEFDFDRDRLMYALFAMSYITDISEARSIDDAFEYGSTVEEWEAYFEKH